MARVRRYRSRLLLGPALAFSASAQAAVIITYEVMRPEPKPTLTIRLDGEGEGQILVTRVGESSPLLRCSKQVCSIELEPGTRVQLSAVLGEKATFGGYHQYPMRTPEALVSILGDPLAHCNASDAITAAALGDVLQCPLTITADVDVAAEFGAVPEEIEMKLEQPLVAIADVVKPIVETPEPTPIDAEKLESMEVAIIPPPPPKVPPPPQLKPPPPPQEQPKPKTPPPPPPPNMVMVEVKDKNTVEKAPEDAKHLSDKNRDVEEETRAKETNLDKESDGETIASREHDDKTSKDVGGPDEKIRQNEETKPTTDERAKETDHNGKGEVATGVKSGEGGQKGEEGTGEKAPGVLAMRGIGGRGRITDQSKDGKKPGKQGTPGLNTPLNQLDYERLMGKDKLEEERQIAARKMGSRKGRWEKKVDAIKSSLENFTPDVRPGNQTALKTRAHPYALYIARMHRRIHELWGFGFLEQLDDKAADYPLNNPDLWVNLEVSVNQDGTLHKVTIAKTSGKTEFDVAAVDVVITAGPFDTTPEAIRSVDGRIYLRWGFYRNWRQCGTFNVEPYILTSVPENNDVGVLDDGAMVKGVKQPRITPKRHPIGETVVTPDDGKSKDKVSPDSSVTDKQAVFAANQWISGFATATVDKLVKMSLVPFYAGGKIAAETPADLKEMYGGLIVESGAMKEWKLLKPSEYASGGTLPDGNVVVQVRTTKESFAIVMTRTPSGEYRATQLAR